MTRLYALAALATHPLISLIVAASLAGCVDAPHRAPALCGSDAECATLEEDACVRRAWEAFPENVGALEVLECSRDTVVVRPDDGETYLVDAQGTLWALYACGPRDRLCD